MRAAFTPLIRVVGTHAVGTLYLDDELLVDVLAGNVGVKVGRLEEAQEELVHDFQVRPRRFLNAHTRSKKYEDKRAGPGIVSTCAAGMRARTRRRQRCTDQDGLVFVRVEGVAVGVELRRHGAEQVLGYLATARTAETPAREHA